MGKEHGVHAHLVRIFACSHAALVRTAGLVARVDIVLGVAAEVRVRNIDAVRLGRPRVASGALLERAVSRQIPRVVTNTHGFLPAGAMTAAAIRTGVVVVVAVAAVVVVTAVVGTVVVGQRLGVSPI